MIIDNLNNSKIYEALHPLFRAAFEYIHSAGKEIEDGRYEIEKDKLLAIVSNKPGVNKEAALSKFECHNSNIDIQYCIKGVERFGWKPREKCILPNGGFNEEKDVQFYNDEPDTFFELKEGQFVIFFPGDVHAPMIGEGMIKKMVVKVKIV